MVEITGLEISIKSVYIDPSTDELVTEIGMNNSKSETRTPLSEFFPDEADVTATDELNIEIRGVGYTRINPIPDDLTPPERHQ